MCCHACLSSYEETPVDAHCTTLQHTLHHTATHTAPHCNTHCTTLQHTLLNNQGEHVPLSIRESTFAHGSHSIAFYRSHSMTSHSIEHILWPHILQNKLYDLTFYKTHFMTSHSIDHILWSLSKQICSEVIRGHICSENTFYPPHCNTYCTTLQTHC